MSKREPSALRKENESKWCDLMARSQDGDSAAYNHLLSELVPYIKNFCRLKVDYVDLSDDVVQEALVAVHRFRHTYDPARPFLPWLHTIIRNKVIDSLRHRHRLLANEVFSNETVELASALPAAETEDLQKLLGGLPEEYREPLKLLKLEEYSVDEVAAKLGLTQSAVKMRIHRAFKLLKKRAERDIYED